MIVGVQSIPACFDVEQHLFGCPPEAVNAHLQAYDNLLRHPIRTDPAGFPAIDSTQLLPALASAWQASKNGLRYTFDLRPGVRSRAGNELTAHDVKWSWERAFALNSWSARAARLAGMGSPDSVRVAQSHTVQFHLDQPNPDFPRLLAGALLPIHDLQEVRRHCPVGDPWGHEWLRSHSIGFGPFGIESGPNHDEAVFVANQHYWQGTPSIKRIMLRPLRSSSARANALQAGSLDVALDLPARQIQELKEVRGIRVTAFGSGRQVAIRMDPTFTPFGELAVRRAIACAVPYEEIAQGVFGGEDVRPSASLTDQRAAKGFLRAAGYAAGFRLPLAVPEGDIEAELIAAAIQRAGMKLDLKIVIEKLPLSTMRDRRSSRQLPFYLERCAEFLSPFKPEELDPQPDVHAVVVAQPQFHFASRTSISGFVCRPDGHPRYFELRQT